MTRRIRDRERLKREIEDSKRALEHARPPDRKGRSAPRWPKLGKRKAADSHSPKKP
jgi:hypothetical protein